MQAEEANGDGNASRRVRRSRRIVNKGDDGLGHDVEHDAEGNRHEEGDAHSAGRAFVYFVEIFQRKAVADGRHEAHGHGRRQNCRQVDEGHGHARQIAEQFRCLSCSVSGDFQTAGNDEQIQVRHDGKHDAR